MWQGLIAALGAAIRVVCSTGGWVLPSRADLSWSELKVGIVVALSAAVLLVIIFLMTGRSGLFQKKLRLTTYVSDAAGLRTGAPVELQGVLVGNVTHVGLATNPPNVQLPVRIDMRVQAKHLRWLRMNSMVELRSESPLGDMLVNINRGSPSSPPVHDGAVLNSQSATSISELLVSTHTMLQNANDIVTRVGSLLDQIQSGKGSVGKLLYSDELYNRLNAVTANVQQITADVKNGRGTIGRLTTDDTLYRKLDSTLDGVNALLNKVQTGNGSLAKIINDPQLYNRANQLIASLQQTAQALNSTRGTIGMLINDPALASKLRDTTNRVDALVTGLQQGQGSAGKFFKDPTLYNNANLTMTQLQQLLAAIKRNPKRYLTIHLKIF